MSVTQIPSARSILLHVNDKGDAPTAGMEDAFFASLRLPTGIYKTTHHGRFRDLDDAIAAILPARRPLRVLDVAASSGATTADWVEHLRAMRVPVQMHATDLMWFAYFVSLGRSLHVLVDRNCVPLQYEVRGRTIPGRPGRRNWLSCWWALATLRVTVRLVRRYIGRDRGDAIPHCGLRVRRVTLASARLKALPEILLFEEDVFGLPVGTGQYDVIRAANILNPRYFSSNQLRSAVATLSARVAPLGLLVLCRTEEGGRNLASIYEKQRDGRLRMVRRLGGGVEIEAIVEAADSREATTRVA